MNPPHPFEAFRPLLFAIAYRMLSSAAEAEDMVQETYLRYQTVPADEIRALKPFLTTVITRLCLNHLQSAQVQRESYIGPWLPEPMLTSEDSTLAVVDAAAEFESISLAFLILLEKLTPVERAVFLLRAVFDYEYREIAAIVQKEEAACRQLFSRARKSIATQRPRFQASPVAHRRLLDGFLQAVQIGKLDELMQLLAEDVTMWADGGGKIRGAATRPLVGRRAVAQFVLGSLRLVDAPFAVEVSQVNNEPALILRVRGKPQIVLFIEAGQTQIRAIRVIGNPDKLRWV